MGRLVGRVVVGRHVVGLLVGRLIVSRLVVGSIVGVGSTSLMYRLVDRLEVSSSVVGRLEVRLVVVGRLVVGRRIVYYRVSSWSKRFP